MFKHFIKRLIEAENREDALNNVLYGEDSIIRAQQWGKITIEEYQMLIELIDKMA